MYLKEIAAFYNFLVTLEDKFGTYIYTQAKFDFQRRRDRELYFQVCWL